MNWLSIDLARLSGGSGWRAAGILVVAHLVPALVIWGLWFLGLLPIFDDARWLVSTVAITLAVGIALWMFLAFGFWGTVRTLGQGHGESYEHSFSPGIGFALGWLRWFMQIVLVAMLLLPIALIWTNVRWWHVVGTDELDALPALAETIPVMEDWERTEVEASETGIPEFMDSTMHGPEPEGYITQTFEVPSSMTFEELKEWLESPEWTDPAEGEAFGAIRLEHCNAQNTYCDVQRVPAEGAHPEHFFRAEFREPAYGGDSPEVRIRLTYRQYVPPEYEVSAETVQRAEAIPVPSDWTRFRAVAEETVHGEQFTQNFGVPETFGREDLEAWIRGSAWTDPADGEPFGELEVGSCREVGTSDPTTFLCSARVVSAEGGAPSDGGLVESITTSLDSDQTVRVTLERNG